MSIPKHKVESLFKQWLSGSKDLKYIKQYSDRLLITILIWNNLVNTYTASLATVVAIKIFNSMAVWMATWIVTLLLLLFGEIVPKSFAIKNAEKISLSVAKIYKILMILLYPFVFLIEIITKIFTGNNKIDKVSEEEIQAFIDMWKETWTLEKDEHEHLKNLLEFSDTVVEEIMTPRVKMDKLSDNTTIQDAMDYVMSHTHSRIPVYHEDVDHIIWIVNMRMLIQEIRNWNKDKKLKDIKLIKAIKVPLRKPIDELLKIFQKSHKHIAIVIDEYWWVAGLVTLEDIIEEVFWEIQDETDKEENPVKKINENEYIVKSTLLLEDVLYLFNFQMHDLWFDEKKYDWATLSYFITDQLERFPNKWEIIKFSLVNDNMYIQFKVLDIFDSVIQDVEIKTWKKNEKK